MRASTPSFNAWCGYCGKRLRLLRHGYESVGPVKDPMHYVYCPGCHTETRRGVVCTAEQALEDHRKLCAARSEREKAKLR